MLRSLLPRHVLGLPPVLIAADAPIKPPEGGNQNQAAGQRSGQHIWVFFCSNADALMRFLLKSPSRNMSNERSSALTCANCPTPEELRTWTEQECETRREVRREASRGHRSLPSRTAEQMCCVRGTPQRRLTSKHTLANPPPTVGLQAEWRV